jgi:hypothetical protein
MARYPFEPLGAKSRKQMVIDLFSDKGPDAVVTYDQLGEALDLHPVRQRNVIRTVVHTASGALTVEHRKVLASVRNVGYRVIRPEEHVQHAAKLQRKAGKQVVVAREQVDAVDLESLSEEGRRIAMAAGAVLAYQATQLQRLDLRQKGLEKLVEGVTTRVDATVAATQEHKDRLAQLEARIAKLGG